MENWIDQVQRETEKDKATEEDKTSAAPMDVIDQTTLAPNALTNMSNAGPTNPATIDPSQEDLDREAEKEAALLKIEHKLVEKVNKIMQDAEINSSSHNFLLLFTALFVGAILGALVFYCIKKFTRNGSRLTVLEDVVDIQP